MNSCKKFDLSTYNTFGLQSECNEFYNISNIRMLKGVIKECNYPILVLGGGSNVILPRNLEKSVIYLENKELLITEHPDSFTVVAGAGWKWDVLLLKLLNNGIYGAENLAAIPGNLGAAPVQNIGAYGVEIERFIKSVEGYDLEKNKYKKLLRSECEFSYRDSVFKHQLKGKFIITKVTLSFNKIWQPTLSYGELQSISEDISPLALFHKITDIRWSKLPEPKIYGNAGSFFKNPYISKQQLESVNQANSGCPFFQVSSKYFKIPAAWLIDQCGLKSYSIGGITVYDKQPLVLCNTGCGSYDEVVNLVAYIKEKVQTKFGIWLEEEVNILS